MMKRRRFKQTTSLAERLTQQADRLRERAVSLSPGSEQTLLWRKVRQAETALRIDVGNFRPEQAVGAPNGLLRVGAILAMPQPVMAEAPNPDQQGMGTALPALKSAGLPTKFQGWPKVSSSFTWLVPLKSLVKSCTPQGDADCKVTTELTSHPSRSCPHPFLPGIA